MRYSLLVLMISASTGLSLNSSFVLHLSFVCRPSYEMRPCMLERVYRGGGIGLYYLIERWWKHKFFPTQEVEPIAECSMDRFRAGRALVERVPDLRDRIRPDLESHLAVGTTMGIHNSLPPPPPDRLHCREVPRVWSRVPFRDVNIGDPVTLSARETSRNIFAFEVSGSSVNP